MSGWAELHLLGQSAETPCPAITLSLIYMIMCVPVTDAGSPVWTTNSKRSVDVEMMYVLHKYSYVD